MILLLEVMSDPNSNSNTEGTQKLLVKGANPAAKKYAKRVRRRSKSPQQNRKAPKQKLGEFAPGLVAQLEELNKPAPVPFLRSENLQPKQKNMSAGNYNYNAPNAEPGTLLLQNGSATNSPPALVNGGATNSTPAALVNGGAAPAALANKTYTNSFKPKPRRQFSPATLSKNTGAFGGSNNNNNAAVGLATRVPNTGPGVAYQPTMLEKAGRALGGETLATEVNNHNNAETRRRTILGIGLNNSKKYDLLYDPKYAANGSKAINTGINFNAARSTVLNANTGAMSTSPTLTGDLFGSSNNNFANEGPGTQENAYMRVAQMKKNNPNYAQRGKSLGQLSNTAQADLELRIVNSDVPGFEVGKKIGFNVTVKPGSALSMGMGMSMPGLPGMPSTKGLTNSLKAGLGALGAAGAAGYASILAKLGNVKFTLPNGKIALPNGKDVTELVAKLLARLPNGAQLAEMISMKGLSGLKLDFKLGLPAISQLFEQKFTFLTNFRRLGVLITLSQWFDNQPDPTIRTISADLKKYENDARDAVKRTVALASTLQSMGGREGKFSKNNVAALLGSLRADISTLNELKAELNKTLKATLGESVSFKEAANQDELEKVLDTLSVGYDAMSTSELKQVTVQNAADFKQIVENFKKMVAIPQKMLDGIKDITEPDTFFKKLLEEGRDARGIMAKTGYNITRAASNVGSSISRGFGSFRNRFTSKTSANNNGTKKNNRPLWRRALNKVKGAYGTLKERLFKKKNVEPNTIKPRYGSVVNPYTPENRIRVQGGLPALGPSTAAAGRTRKNRRHH